MGTYHHGDLRAALIEAGIQLLEAEGLEALTLRAAARRVGVSHAAPARHFPDATSFLAAIAAAGYRKLVEYLSASVAMEPLQALSASGSAYVSFALEHPQWYRVVFHPSIADVSAYPELRDASQSAFDVVQAQVRRSMTAGAIREDDVARTALSVWATVHGTSMLAIDGQLARSSFAQPVLELAESVLRLLYLGLRPTDGPHSTKR